MLFEIKMNFEAMHNDCGYKLCLFFSEVEERGVYDARAFSYLVGDVGR